MDRQINKLHNALQLDGRTETPDTTEVTVVLADSRGVLIAYGATVPSDGETGYAKGCFFIDTNAAAGAVMLANEGDETSADFNTSLVSGDISAVTSDDVGIVGGASSGAAAPKLGITVKNGTGGTLTKGTLVRITGYSSGYLITKADADAGLMATHVLAADILDTASGTAYAVTVVTGIDTSGGSAGDPLYLSDTAGEFTVTAPSGADKMVQRVGVIVTSHASTGSALFFPSMSVVSKVGTSQLQDSAVTTAKIADAAVTPAKTNIVEARTATADGLTTGIIGATTRHVTVTSADANHIIVLPAPTPGWQVVINVGATGFELRSSDPATIAINGGTGSGAESAIPANSTIIAICISATAWKAIFLDADGDVAKVEAAA